MSLEGSGKRLRATPCMLTIRQLVSQQIELII